MHYTLHQLEVFLKVSEHKSITRASEDLFLSQPAVSMQLKKFQDQFAIPLTEVIGRQLYVTDFGKEISIAAERILGEVEAINYKTKEYQETLSGKLKVSVASTGKYVMPYFLSDFLAEHRGVDLMMDVTNKATVVKSLTDNKVDFALVSVIPDQLKTNFETLLSNKLYLVGSPKLHLKDSVSDKKKFEEFPLLFREPGSATRLAMEGFVKKNKLPTFKSMELTSNEAVKQAVIAGLGYSVMPLIGIKNELEQNELEIIPYKGLPIVTEWNLIWLKAKKLSPVTSSFLDFIRLERDRIVKDTFGWFEKY
ncbi:MAG: DNA-binding transcriptional LysR family regulator [Bacteroidia bacterium]|jgi:DNA-binding transcriptional LysR family regulator